MHAILENLLFQLNASLPIPAHITVEDVVLNYGSKTKTWIRLFWTDDFKVDEHLHVINGLVEDAFASRPDMECFPDYNPMINGFYNIILFITLI